MSAPKLFISYSWSSADHERWVINLATELVDNGVDVILDKWDLKEGHDAVKFMEKMVNDPEIKKVAMLVDEAYAAKADGRAGGVGTETQIISKKVYDNQEQGKFVAVVLRRDENGEPYLPTYYKPRKYIDLSAPDMYSEGFDKLLRWIFDKPLHKKPQLGKGPSFIETKDTMSLGTTASFRRALDAVKNNTANAGGVINEYFGIFAQNLEKLRIERVDDAFDNLVISSIKSFLPYRNEAIQLFSALGHYSTSEENIHALHRFLESLLPYMDKPEHITAFRDCDFDNYVFIIHEVFLYAIAILIRAERFEAANYIMEQGYYLPSNATYGRDVMVDFRAFRRHMLSLSTRNERPHLNRVSLRADILKERCSGIGIEFKHLMQADFVLFMRAHLHPDHNLMGWYPESLLYASRTSTPFEVFARAVSKKYFDRIKCLLAIDVPTDLDDPLKRYAANQISYGGYGWNVLVPAVLLGRERLATKP
ncbi:MAG: TIR domain-containing protein [Candidatus Brocadiia bacterium]|nr:MAG: TIR domain-containing protein [Candidatus Brocadiia bacterium]